MKGNKAGIGLSGGRLLKQSDQEKGFWKWYLSKCLKEVGEPDMVRTAFWWKEWQVQGWRVCLWPSRTRVVGSGKHGRETRSKITSIR